MGKNAGGGVWHKWQMSIMQMAKLVRITQNAKKAQMAEMANVASALWLWVQSVMRCPSPLSVQSTSHSKSNTRTPLRAEMGGAESSRAEEKQCKASSRVKQQSRARGAENHACASSSLSLSLPCPFALKILSLIHPLLSPL